MTCPRVSYYNAAGEAHWPDAFVGSDEFYAIDWTNALLSNGDSITGTPFWNIPVGLAGSDKSVVFNKTQIKLSADAIGKHKVTCTINTVKSQVLVQKINLKVM
jgi:hypothetical protein